MTHAAPMTAKCSDNMMDVGPPPSTPPRRKSAKQLWKRETLRNLNLGIVVFAGHTFLASQPWEFIRMLRTMLRTKGIKHATSKFVEKTAGFPQVNDILEEMNIHLSYFAQGMPPSRRL